MATSGPTGAGGNTVVSGTTWTNNASAQGIHDSAVATWTNATSGGTTTIDLTTYGTWSSIPAGSTINSVTVDVYQWLSAATTRMSSVTAQLFVGTTAKLPVQTLTLSTTVGNHNAFTVTDLPTLAELQGGTIKVRIIATRAAVTTACNLLLDAAEITVDYTAPVPATVTPATVAAAASIPTPIAGRTRTFAFAGTSGTVTGLTLGQQYSVQVRARDAAGNWSALSAPVTFTTTSTVSATATPSVVAGVASVPGPTVTAASTATAAPATIAASAAIPAPTVTGASSATKAPATVSAVASVPGPAVSAGSNATSSPAAVGATTAIPTPIAGTIRSFSFAGTSGQVTGLTLGATYSARVRAVDGSGNRSDWSAPVSFTTSGSTGPTVVAGTARPVVNGGSVALDVTATPPGGQTITGHSWAIISGGGSLTGATTATPTYTAPGSGSGLAVIRDTVTASGGGTASADVTVSYHSTVVAAENALTGTPRATWDLADPNLAGVSTLQGFCDGFTADKSETVNFKIAQSDTAGWSADVYRLGWYGGNGARFYATLTPTGTQLTASQSQPAPGDADASTTKLSADCGNWATTLTWTPPSWAPSGIYVLRLNRTGGGASHVMFIVRDDARSADLMLMPSDSTWNAYNAFGGMGANLLTGNSLYFGTGVDQYNADCARFVSYNRPVVNRAAANTGQAYGSVEWSTFFTGEYPMVRFLERNGYDVKYYGCIDAAGDSTGAKLANVGAAMAVGHNEYWSDGMRAGWEAAKAAGKNLFFCASNEVFWRLVGSNADASGRPRTWECQKSTINGRGSTRPDWTGTWRDPDGAGKGGNNPENQLTGTIFVVNGPDLRSLVVPFAGGYSAQPLWRHTTVASLTSGQSWTSPSQVLGFEWDTYGPAGVNTTGAAYLANPHPQAVYCSDVTYAVSSSIVLTDAGDVYGTGNVTHRLVVHPGSSGGMVFGTGTINWALGVDDANTYQLGNDNTSPVIQQATVNMLADMGADAPTLMTGLTAPTPVDWYVDLTAPGGTVAATASIPTPTLVVGGGVTKAPATVAASAAVPMPTVTATSTRTPATVAASAAIASPVVVSSATRSPATVAATASIPTAAVVATGSATALPATVAASTSVPTSVAAASSRVNPAAVTATTSIPTPTVRVSAALTLTTVAGVAAVASPAVVAVQQATRAPATVAATASVPNPPVSTFSKITYRPFGGTTARPGSGTTTRPVSGVTVRP